MRRSWRVAAVVALASLLAGAGFTGAGSISPDELQQIAEELPLLPPDLVWEQQLPGVRRAELRIPQAPTVSELDEAIRALSAEWPLTGYKTDWTGTPGLVTHLARPGENPRAVFWLADGHLYLVEKGQQEWHTQRLTDLRIDVTSVVDLSGDGQPEIVAASQYGSGAILALRVFAWDQQRIWMAFSHTGAQEPGHFGWFDAESDGRRDLWIDTSEARGLFRGIHGPFLRDRLRFRWDGRTYRQVGQYRFATPFYHLNRYLYFASKQDWLSASRHVEPASEVDRGLAAQLGLGPFSGGSDMPFVNGRMYFGKDGRNYFADFGPTGRLVRLGIGGPPETKL